MTRVFVLALLGFVLLTLLGPLLQLVGITMVSVDVGAVIVLHVSMAERRPVFGQGSGLRLFPGGLESASVALTLLLGYFTDLLGGEVKGLHALALAVVYLVGRMVSRQVSLVGRLSQCLVSFAVSLLASLVVLAARWACGLTSGGGMLAVILGQATLTAAVAPLLMKLLRWIDLKLSGELADRDTLRLG